MTRLRAVLCGNRAGEAGRGGFGDPHVDTSKRELLSDSAGRGHRRRLDELETAFPQVSSDQLHNRRVIDNGIDPVGGGWVHNELDVHEQRLRNTPFAFPDADDGGRFELIDGYLHVGVSSAMGQRGRVVMAKGSMSPAASRSWPAKAIIAPLSVQSSGGA